MQRFLLIAIALCFVFAGTFDSFAQTRKVVKKPAKRKLVKCIERGKTVYRTKCKVAIITNPSIVMIPKKPTKKVEEPEQYPYGISDGLGNGQGSGGGMGTGRGQGNGNGVGSGQGNGNGNGYGDGDGNNTIQTLPKIRNSNTDNLKIISKPKANYTDAARQNTVQGNVVLRVQFLANGQIGNISVVSGLPNGLTENAVAAAKGIRFEPAKKNGVPYSVTKTVSYNFTIY